MNTTASHQSHHSDAAAHHDLPPRSAAQRGRPSGYAPDVVGMMCGLIRELGLSDSAAAERLGLSTSTVSRWKQEHAEMRLALRKAREECRALHLMKIIESSQAQNGRGWRASAWLLERLFPEDYAPSATQREKFRALAERRLQQEESETDASELEELMSMSINGAFNPPEFQESPAPEDFGASEAPDGDCTHPSILDQPVASSSRPAPAPLAPSPAAVAAVAAAGSPLSHDQDRAGHSHPVVSPGDAPFYSEADSQNSRNAACPTRA